MTRVIEVINTESEGSARQVAVHTCSPEGEKHGPTQVVDPGRSVKVPVYNEQVVVVANQMLGDMDLPGLAGQEAAAQQAINEPSGAEVLPNGAQSEIRIGFRVSEDKKLFVVGYSTHNAREGEDHNHGNDLGDGFVENPHELMELLDRINRNFIEQDFPELVEVPPVATVSTAPISIGKQPDADPKHTEGADNKPEHPAPDAAGGDVKAEQPLKPANPDEVEAGGDTDDVPATDADIPKEATDNEKSQPDKDKPAKNDAAAKTETKAKK